MNTFRTPIISSSNGLIDRIQQEIDSFGYDYDAIKIDLEGKPYPRLKSAKEVEKEKSCICQDGIFYSMWKSQNSIGTLFLSITPYIENRNKEIKIGEKGHAMHLFQRDNGKYGAISKSSIPELGFQEPIYTTIRDLLFNASIIKGFENAINPYERLRGLEYYVVDIRKRYIEFEQKVVVNHQPITHEDLFDVGVCFFKN